MFSLKFIFREITASGGKRNLRIRKSKIRNTNFARQSNDAFVIKARKMKSVERSKPNGTIKNKSKAVYTKNKKSFKGQPNSRFSKIGKKI